MSSKTEAALPDLSPLNQSSALVDQVVRSAMNTISEEHQLRTDALQLEGQRLITKYGPDSPQAKGASMRLSLHDQMKLGIKLQTERLNLRTPDPISDSVVFYGRILDKEGGGLEGLVVQALDGRAQAIGRTETDDRGVFELPIRVAVTGPAGTAEAKEVIPPAGGTDGQIELLLQVSDRRNRILYRDEKPSQLAAGQLSYREIVLPEQLQNSKAGSTAKRRA